MRFHYEKGQCDRVSSSFNSFIVSHSIDRRVCFQVLSLSGKKDQQIENRWETQKHELGYAGIDADAVEVLLKEQLEPTIVTDALIVIIFDLYEVEDAQESFNIHYAGSKESSINAVLKRLDNYMNITLTSNSWLDKEELTAYKAVRESGDNALAFKMYRQYIVLASKG